MNWIFFNETPPPADKWRMYHVITDRGEVGTSVYSVDTGFCDVTVNGIKQPVGIPIIQWAYMQE